MDASAFPTIDGGEAGFAVGSLADYLGIPTSVVDGPLVSALPFRGAALIWNEFYRDQDLETPLTIDLTSGADTTTSRVLQNCSWEKDYFTVARPWEQKGPAITLPIGTTAPVRGIGFAGDVTTMTATTPVREVDASSDYLGTVNTGTDPAIRAMTGTAIEGVAIKAVGGDSDVQRPDVFADLSGASAITINALREAMALQRYEEARAMYGSRYTEYLRYLNVQSGDARLQRPEYLGGGRNTFQFSEVLQTGTDFDADTGVGTLRGHGIGALRSNRYRRYFQEHGYVFTFLSVRPKTIYADGLQRHWSRRIKEDFWQKELQTIGQQELLNKEARMAHASPDEVFGYTDRYDEYRRSESWISGEFRTSVLDFWHFARLFSTDPALNADFVKCVPRETPFAVNTNHTMWAYVRNSVQSRRLVMQTARPMAF